MIFRFLLVILTFFLVFFLINNSIRLEDLKGIILTLPKEQIFLFMAVSVLISVLKAWRFLILLNSSNIVIGFWDTLKTFVASQTTTPLPGGEALRGVLVHKQAGISMIRTAGPVIIQAFLEFFSALVIVFIGSLFIKELQIPVLISGGGIGVLISLLLHKRTFPILDKFLPENKWIEVFLNKLQLIQNQARKNFSKDILFRVFILSIATNFLGGLLIYLIADAYRVNLNFLQSLLLYSTSIVIQTISVVSPGGIGFTEGGMAGMLLLFNVEFAKALAVVLVFRVVTLVFSVFLGIIFLLIFYHKHFLLPIYKFIGRLL